MPRLEARAEPSVWMSIASPVIAIGLTLVAGAVLLTALGRDPADALWVYFVSPFTDGYSRAELVVKAVPLALIGAGLAVSFRANVWNIGAAGQYVAACESSKSFSSAFSRGRLSDSCKHFMMPACPNCSS